MKEAKESEEAGAEEEEEVEAVGSQDEDPERCDGADSDF
jgi:hypothetical protein